MNFVDCVNRILRMNGIIRGDTDPIVNFQSQQHGATMNVAIIAVQDAINDLLGDEIIPKERGNSSITLVDSVATGVRTYTLAADFAKFWNDQAFFYDVSGNVQIFEYAGGERQLQLDIANYAIPADQHGNPTSWYWVDSPAQTVGFFPNPDSVVAGNQYTYDYQKAMMPSAYNDVLPFHQDTQAMAFTEMASVRFEMLMKGAANVDIRRVPSYVSAKAKTVNLINPKASAQRYGHTYR